jgi:membrane peptidoglycan carboxypeptidase
MVAIDPQTGDILVMVGSRDYFDDEIDGNFNTTLAPRQPGSSIKPIVYASAFTKGYTPDTKVYDVKTQFSSVCEPWDLSNENPCYSPNNYNNKFVGPISLRNALAQSLNIPAVKVLYLTGIKDAIKLAGDMGISTLNDPDRLGLTLVLGGGEVKLLEHTGAYGVFANEGVKAQRRPILRIEDAQGRVIEEMPVREERVLSKDVTLQITDILTDNNARAPLWGYNSAIYFPDRDVAAKSGSTNNSRDAWIMGYAPNIAVGVWVGNNDNSPMNGLSGLIATPMWRSFMDIALAKLEKKSFGEPPATHTTLKPILRGEIFDAGMLLQHIQSGSTTLDLAGVSSGIHNILHYVDRRDPLGPYPSNPANDSQYNNWEYSVQKWKAETYASIIPSLSTSTILNNNDNAVEDGENNSSRTRRNRNNNEDN